MNKNEAIAKVKEIYMESNVILSVERSNSRRAVLKCDRGGSHRARPQLNDNAKKRITSTKLIECPVRVYLSTRGGHWDVRKVIGEHNHPIEDELVGHAAARKLNDEVLLL
jgi:FAR1 DNA-binding domain